MVVTPGIEGRERAAFLVVRPTSYEVLTPGVGQPVDGAFEPQAGKRLRFTGPRSEPGAPEQPLSFGDSKLSPPHGDTRHTDGIGSDSCAADPRSRGGTGFSSWCPLGLDLHSQIAD
jgi:hypothetical protein